MITLRYSSIDTFLRCRRAYYYSNVKGIEARELPPSLFIGKVCAEAMALIHTHKKVQGIKLLTEHIDTYRNSKPVENNKLTSLCILLTVLQKYIEQQAVWGEPEYKWKTEITKNLSIAGTVDLYTDKKEVYEFKYSAKADYYDDYTMGDQVGLYMLGTNCHKSTARVIFKPYIKTSLLENTKEFLARCKKILSRKPIFKDIEFYQSDFQAYQKKLLGRVGVIAEELQRCKTIKDYYQTTKMHCYAPFYCQYLPICKADGKISEYAFGEKGEL